MKELVTEMCKQMEFKVRPSLSTKRKRREERGDRKCPARCRVKWRKLLKNWLKVWGQQIVSGAFNANQRGLLSLNWSESPRTFEMLLGMLSLLQMTTNSLLDTLFQELFTPSFVYANAPLSPERSETKRCYNFIYCDLVRDLKILNERHYEQCLKDSEELRECEVYLNPAHLEGLKKFLGP